MMQHLVQLQRDKVVDLGDAGRDHLVGIAADGHRAFEHLRDEFLDQALAALARACIGEPPLFDDLVEKTASVPPLPARRRAFLLPWA